MTPVRSSNLAKVGYDATNNKLYIEFKDSSLYVYFGVPKGVFNDLLSAPSKGQYFHRNIRGKYHYQQI